MFRPQHLNVPAVRYAHVWELPSASRSTVPPTLIVVGVLRLIGLGPTTPGTPSPSCQSLFWPQHFNVPAVRYAHV